MKDPRIAVVVPAWHEELILARMLARVPKRAEWIVVVDDGSKDSTFAVAQAEAKRDSRIVALRLSQNQGVGAAIVRGYQEALALGADIMVVMAGDDQMDPADFDDVVEPVISGRADYVKGNRLVHPEAQEMPVVRRVGTRFLARLTGLIAGFPGLDDAQCGYTALSADAARRLPLQKLYPRYGYPNDMVLRLGEAGLRIVEVTVAPVYADEVSGLAVHRVIKPISGILARGAARRLYRSLKSSVG